MMSGQDEIDDGWARRSRMVQRAPEMYALLKELEWSTTFYNSNPCCPSCLRGEESGHEPTCRLAAVLKAVEESDAR